MDKDPQSLLVLIGAGAIGVAVARRVGSGMHILLADLNAENTRKVATTLSDAGFRVSSATVDISSDVSVRELVQEACTLGPIEAVILAAGVSPVQAAPKKILEVDLYGTALVLEEFGKVVARGGAGLVIASQSGHRLPPLPSDQNKALALCPATELLDLPFLEPVKTGDSLSAYQISKRGNVLRVMAESVRWGKRGARLNAISPGIIMTPLAKDELNGPRASTYRRMIEASAAGRAGTPDEVANVASLLMGQQGAFITGSDILMDGGVTAAYWYGELQQGTFETDATERQAQ